jgi:hypothetical protein
VIAALPEPSSIGAAADAAAVPLSGELARAGASFSTGNTPAVRTPTFSIAPDPNRDVPNLGAALARA